MPRNRSGRPTTGESTLTREHIISTALRLIDANGVDALSMRKLAKALDVDPMAIYYHVPNKDALMVGVIETVFAEFSPQISDGMGWREQVRAFAVEYRRVTVGHPHLVDYLIQSAIPQGLTPSKATAPNSATVALALQANEILYKALSGAGLPPRNVVYCADVIVDFLHGYILAEATGALDDTDDHSDARGALRAGLDQAPADAYPTMRAILGQLEDAAIRVDFDAEFDIILAGIAAQLT